MHRFIRNHSAWSFERWWNFLMFFFAWIVLLLMILDGVFFFLFQTSLDMMARRIATYAATVKIPMNEAGQTPAELANIRCLKAYEYFKDGTPNGKKFLGYTAKARQRFLAQLQTGAKEMSTLDTSVHTRRGTGNGCYYEHDDTTKILKINILIEGRDGENVQDGNWPVFARGLLKFFGKKPVTMYGRASYTAEGTGTGVHGYHKLEHEIGRSLKAYGVTTEKLISQSGNESVNSGNEITPLIEGKDELVVGFGDPSTRTDGGRTFGVVEMPVADPTDKELPLILSTLIYKWRVKIPGYCTLNSEDMLEIDDWERKSANGFKWDLSASEFIDIDQDRVNLLPCWESQCSASFGNTNTKSGRYAYIQDYPKYYLPTGKDKEYTDKSTGDRVSYYFARTTNIDGNNRPVTLKKGGSGETSEEVKMTCAFSRMQHGIQQGKGQEATIATVIDTTNDTHGHTPENDPIRRDCPAKIKHGVRAQADFGPYEELRPNCERPTESWNKIVKDLHEESSRYQNPLDRFIPYYKYAETCPTGTPLCGYFGISRVEAFEHGKQEWYYQYQGDEVPQVKFDMQARLLTNSNYTRQHNRLSLECAYKRYAVLQHCCRGMDSTAGKTWCEEEHRTPNHSRAIKCRDCTFGSTPPFGVAIYKVVPEPKTLADHQRDNINSRGKMKIETCCEASCTNGNKCGSQVRESRNFEFLRHTCPCGIERYMESLPTDKDLIFDNCSDDTPAQQFGIGDSKSNDPAGRCQAINTN